MSSIVNFQEILDLAKSKGLIQEEDSSIIFYDVGLLRKTLHQLKVLFPENCRHTVAVKSNPLRKVLQFIGMEGVGHEAASAGEVMLAAENSDGWIVYDGPAKTPYELQQMLPYKSRLLVNANSFYDLEKVVKFPFENIGLRINTQVQTGVHSRFDVSQANSKFGVPITERKKIIQAYVDHPSLNALHFHLGSGMKTAAPFREALEKIRLLLQDIGEARLTENISSHVQYLDIGGGLLGEEEAGEYSRWKELGNMLSLEFPDLCKQYTLITEFGQYVHTHNSWLYSEIADILTHTEPSTLILHQGANMFVRQAYTDVVPPFKYYVAGREEAPGNAIYNLAGPLCFSGDYIAKGAVLPEVKIGDRIIIDHIGANTYALWSQHCSFGFPKVIGYTENVLSILKEGEGLQEVGKRW